MRAQLMKRAQFEIMKTLIRNVFHADMDWEMDRTSCREFSLCKNPNVTEIIPELLAEFPQLEWNWDELSVIASAETIMAHPEWPWKRSISLNKNITEHMVWHLDHLPWRLGSLADHDNITPQFVLDLCDRKSASYPCLSYNINVTAQFVMDHQHLAWDWSGLSKTVRMQDMIDHPQLPWQWNVASGRSDVTIVHLLQTAPWDFHQASRYANISASDVIEYIHLPWAWDRLLHNGTIDTGALYMYAPEEWRFLYDGLDDMARRDEKSMNDPYVYYHTSSKQDLRLQFIIDNINLGWDFLSLAVNEFTYERQVLFEKYAREHLAALCIQLYWRKFTRDPAFSTCQLIQESRLTLIS